MNTDRMIWDKEVRSKCKYFLGFLGMLRILLLRTFPIWGFPHTLSGEVLSITSQQGREKTYFNLILGREFEWLDMKKGRCNLPRDFL